MQDILSELSNKYDYLNPEVIPYVITDYLFMVKLFNDIRNDNKWSKQSLNVNDVKGQSIDIDANFDINPSCICVRLLSCNEKPSSSFMRDIINSYKTGRTVDNKNQDFNKMTSTTY